MKWFYSGAKNLDEAQLSPEKSLGGYRSATVVPNGRINSMFNDFSCLTVREGFQETKAFFIKNTFDFVVNNILLYATYPEKPKVDFQIAAVKGDSVELLKSSIDEPYYLDFFDLRVSFAYSDLSVLDTFEVGEVVDIEGTSVPVLDGKRSTFMVSAVKAFETSSQYKAIIIDETTLRLEYRLLGAFGNTPVIQTFNPGTITAPPFDKGFDNSRLIAESLEPGESVGIFLKREPKGFDEPKTWEDYRDWCKEFHDNNWQPTQNTEKKTVNFCLEFSKE